MDAAGVLPSFAGIAVHDAWAPYDTYAGVAGHGLCNAPCCANCTPSSRRHRKADVIWARQAIDALLTLKRAPPAPPAHGRR